MGLEVAPKGWRDREIPSGLAVGNLGSRPAPRGTGAFSTYCSTKPSGVPALRVALFLQHAPHSTVCQCTGSDPLHWCPEDILLRVCPFQRPRLVPGHHQGKTPMEKSWGAPSHR